MMSSYNVTLCIVSLLSFLFIISSSAGLVPNRLVPTSPQKLSPNQNSPYKLIPDYINPEKLIPNPISPHKLIRNQISSRDSKISATSTVKGLTSRPPSSYSLKMESFNTLLKSTYAERYESRPFRVGRYNWTLVVYPNGNTNDNGAGHISLYVALDSSTLISPRQEIRADLRFYVYNKKEKKYFTIQDLELWRFSATKTMWGFPKVLPLFTFINVKNGYLYDVDHCEFGVDVTIPPVYKNSELFFANSSFPFPSFTWFLRGFSTLPIDYSSDVFIIGEKSWNLRVFRNGFGAQEGKTLSVYLYLSQEELLKTETYEKVYVRAKIRVLNQRQSNNDVVGQIDNWFSNQITGWGFSAFVPIDNLRDSSKGLVVNDMLIVQVEMESISSTKYLPN